VVASAKGSPGATTLALALASWWPRPVIVIEAEPAGGDVAARLGLSEEPGLVGMAAALRRNPHMESATDAWITDHEQQTSVGVRVVVAPAGPHQARSALNLLSGPASPPIPDGTDLLIDVGRLSEPQGSGGWIRGNGADLLLWVCRPQLADLAHLAALLDKQDVDSREQAIVLNGSGPFPADEVSTTLGRTVLGHLPADPPGASSLWSGGGRTWVRSALGRASKNLVDSIYGCLRHVSNAQEASKPDSLEPTTRLLESILKRT
jgi:hypothetical protein